MEGEDWGLQVVLPTDAQCDMHINKYTIQNKRKNFENEERT